jgi:hypothetical protein
MVNLVFGHETHTSIMNRIQPLQALESLKMPDRIGASFISSNGTATGPAGNRPTPEPSWPSRMTSMRLDGGTIGDTGSFTGHGKQAAHALFTPSVETHHRIKICQEITAA